MFATERQQLLGTSFCTLIDGKLGFIEAWNEQGEGDIGRTDYRTGFLKDDEIEVWLHNWGKFATEKSNRLIRSSASIRIILSERSAWPELGIRMRKRSFLEVEKAFGLPSETLPVLNALGGREFRNLKFLIGGTGPPPESMSFVHGWHLLSGKSAVTGESAETHQETIFKLIHSVSNSLKHPLVPPFVLLKDHIERAIIFQRRLSSGVTDIERKLNVTRTGRLTKAEEDTDPEPENPVANAGARIDIMLKVNTASTDLINLKRVMSWDLHYAAHIRDVRLHLANSRINIDPVLDFQFNNLLDYVAGMIENEISFTASLSSRVELQFNVLYNLIAHAGNDLNSQIAIAAGLDSSAMKTLAFVTIVFLPPTFVATMFSMSMFNWQDSAELGTVVSSKLWIYWIVSIPLTIIVILGWLLWWRNQKSYYEGRYENNPLPRIT
ncbi:Notoamide biosynthesis cluster protein M' [Paramyrothecium foliicola]|nr:Notoamide biosynthesis cluster protein M' [Paramyrothecium foliicola]